MCRKLLGVITVLLVSIALSWANTGAAVADGPTCTKSWASPVDGLWSDAAKWSPAGVPAATDDVCIAVDGTYTVTVIGSESVNTVSVGAPANTGVQTVWVQGSSSGSAVLTAANGLTNAGTLKLESISAGYNVALVVTNGTLTNAGTGVINVNAGTGGVRTITANLDNQGTVNVNTSATFNKSGGTYTNSGAFTIATGKTLDIASTSPTFNQNGGTLAINGTYDHTGGAFNFNGGAITGTPILTSLALSIGAGATPGATLVTRASSTLTSGIPAGQTVWVQGSPSGTGTLTSANSFTNAGTLKLESVSAGYNVALVVTNGTLTNAGTGVINVNTGTGGVRTITANLDNQGAVNVNTSTTFNKSGGTYTNSGAFTIATGKTLDIASTSPTFNQNGGTLAINGTYDHSGGAFNFNGGAITGTPILTSLALSIGAGATPGATLVTRGSSTLTSDIPAGQTVWVQGSSSGHATLTSANSFTNAGTLKLESITAGYNVALVVTTGTLTNAGTGVINVNAGTGGVRTITSNLDNQGAVNVNTSATFNKPSGIYTNSGAFTIATGKTLDIASTSPTFNQSGGTLAVNGTYDHSGGAFNFNGGAITGTPILTSLALSIGAGATPGATLLVRSSSTLTSDIPAGQTVWVQGSSSGHATLTSANSFINAGTLKLESISAGYNVALVVTTGTLTNSSTGVINVNAGTGGVRTITANLDNQGTVNLNTTTTFNKTSGSYTNSSAFNISGGATLYITGSSQAFHQNSGTMSIGGVFDMTSATFNFNGGAISGTATLTSSALNIGALATSPASFAVAGNSTLNGNISSGQTVWVQGSSSGTGQLTSASGFTNAGTLRMESITAGYQTTLIVTSGPLTNTGVINVNVGTGGGRTITANLINQGTVNVNTDLTFNKSSGVYTNTGAFTIASAKTLTVSTGSPVFNQIGGSLSISGAYTHTGGVFNYNGGTLAIGGSFSLTSGTLNYNGAATTGTPTLTLTSVTLNIGAAATSPVVFVVAGTSTLNGNISSGQTLWVQGNGTAGGAQLTSANGFTNAGWLRMESINGGYQGTLIVTSGTLTNTGVIDVSTGFGGGRTITANLDNQGTVKLNTDLTFNKSSGTYTNTGAFTIASTKTLTVSSGSPVFNQNGGSLTISGVYTQTGGAFNFNGGTLSVGGSYSLTSGTLNFNGADTTGTPTLTLTSVTLNIGAAATSPASFVVGGVSTLNGNISSGQMLWVQGNGTAGGAQLTSFNGFTNAGILRMESIHGGYPVTLKVIIGTLTNTGTINVMVGAGGGRTITANLDNQRTVNVKTSLSLNKSSGIHTNTGTFIVASGQTLTVSNLSPVFNQNGGSLTISGAYDQTGGAFNYNGGTLSVAGSYSLTSGTLNYNGAATTGTPTLTLTSVALNIGAGATSPIVFVVAGTSTLNGNISSGQTLWVQGNGSVGTAQLTSANDFTNAGTLRMESIHGGYPVTLKVTSGTLTNTGTINVNVGTGGGRTIAANLDNQGTVNVNTSLSLNKSSGTYTNTGSFTIASGQTLTVSTLSPVFNQNGGSLTISGAYDQTGGAFNYNGGTLAIGGSFSLTSGTLNFNGADTTGTPTLTLTSVTLNIGAGATSPIVFVVAGTSTLNGNISSGQTLWVQGNGTAGGAQLTSFNGFTNAGTLRMESIHGGYPVTLWIVVTSEALTNTGTINVNQGIGGGRYIHANLDNQGTVNVNTTLSLSKSSGTYTNTGAFTIASAKTLTVSTGSPVFNQNGGSLTISGVFDMNGGTFNFNGGSIGGGGSLNLNSATFKGAGDIAANVNNNGSQFSPGVSPGILSITGNYTQNSTGTLNVEIAGTIPGTGYDQVNITGSASLNGTLKVITDGAFCPEGSFTIMTYGSRSGDFSSKLGLVVGAHSYIPVAGATAYLLNATGPLCNEPPVANPDSYNMNEDTTLGVAAPGVLANDTDPEMNVLTAILVTGPASGVLHLYSNGSFTYTPSHNFNGAATFQYKAYDGSMDSNVVTVTINVAPVDDPVVFAWNNQSVQVAQGATTQANVAIYNPDSVAHQITALSVLNPVVDILAAFDTTSAGQTLPRSISAGQTIYAVLVVDATNALNTQVDVTAGLQSTATPPSDETQISIFVVPAGAPPTPDLKVQIAGDFTPLNPAPGTSVEIGATVTNQGTGASPATLVSFQTFSTATASNVEIGQAAVPSLAPGESARVTFLWNTSNPAAPFPSSEGVALISVLVDPANAIAELNETNNKASQILQVGTVPVTQAYVEVQASVGLTCGPLPVSGVARYALQGATQLLYFPVQGGIVTVRVKDAATGALLQTVTGYHTDVNGVFRLSISPPTVDARIEVEVSDTGFSGTKILSLPNSLVPDPATCVGSPPGGSGGWGGGGGGGGGSGGIVRDLYVFSEDIQFSDEHPSAGESISLLATIHYYGNVPAYDVPVVMNAVKPVGDTLQTTEIGRTLVSFPNSGAGGPALISFDWANSGAAPYVVQVVIESPFSQFELNDEATRALFVEVPETTAAIIVEGTTVVNCGGAFYANLLAKYAIAGATQTLYFPVQGAPFSVSRRNASTSASLGQGSSHTSKAGALYSSMVSAGYVDVIIRIEVTDTTLTYANEIFSAACVPTPSEPAPHWPPPPPPPPGQPPQPHQDVYLFSEDIAFSNFHPELGETITIFASVHYYGSVPALNIPVTINEIVPFGDTLQTIEIGSTTISYPNGGSDSPVYVVMNWKNTSVGARIIQVVVSPPFNQYRGNDAATRLIIVGNPSISDADGDGIVDLNDNCPVTDNATQWDSDMDGIGDACEPVAVADAYSLAEDGLLSQAALGMLANDNQSGGTGLVALFVEGPANGTLEFNADGSFTYTPEANFAGADSFTYQVSNGLNTSNVATVALTITGVNDAPVADAQSVTTPEDTAVAITLAGSDVDGDALVFAIVTPPAHGTLSGAAPNLTYTPAANWNGSDSFTFTVGDGTLTSEPATVSITVTSVNDTPMAYGDNFSVDEDTVLTVPAPGVLGNDVDVDGNTLTATLLPAPTLGTVVLNPDGSFSYTPPANFHGADPFVYKANDGTADSNPATVIITVNSVNDTPVADAQSVTTPEDTAVAITLAGSDVDGDALTFSVVTPPSHGTLDGTLPNVTYTPNANWNGSDSFTFTVGDGTLTSEPATVSITVTPVNDTPMAYGDNFSVDEDTTLTVPAPGVLGNDVDVDGNTLTATLLPAPTLGTVVLNPDGSFSYTPPANFHGADPFVYKANDGTADSNPATVIITVNSVNDTPVADAQSVTTPEDTAVAITLAGSDVDGDALSFSVVTSPSHGTLDGTLPNVTYTPDANYNGPDSFTYKASDGIADSNIATVSITVTAVNDAPVADAQSVTMAEDTTLAVTLTGSDVDGDALSFSVVTSPTHGTLTGVAPGLTYTPDANYNGPDSFTYKASDGIADSNIATVSITVTAVNDAPVAEAQSVTMAEDTTLAVTLTGSDVDGDALSFSVVTSPTHGTLTGVAPGLTYTPDANYNGPDSFTYKANDGDVDSNVATVSISVTAVNDAPVCVDTTLVTAEDTAGSQDLAPLCSDVDGDTIPIEIVTLSLHGASILAGGVLTYTPDPNYHGADSVTFRANDGTVDSDVATVSITVTPVNDAPVADAQSVTTAEDTTLAVTLTGSDVDGDALSLSVVTSPTHGTLTGVAPGLTYTPDANYNGPDSFTYKASDGIADSNIATVSITVTAVNDAPVADAQSVTTAEDTTLAVTLTGSDVDGDALSFSVVTSPTHGTLTGVAPGLTYTPDANYNGPDSFTYKANDGAVDSNVATVTITITPVNDAPMAFGDNFSVDEDTVLTVPAPGVLGNDVDVDGNTLTAALLPAPTLGTVVLNPDGSFSYTPPANFHGADPFVYKANDGTADSNPATVIITVNSVNDAPVADAQSVTMAEDTTLAVTLTGSDVDGDALSFSVVTSPSHGTLDGTLPNVTYTPDANYNGPDSFTYKASDGIADSNIATVSITVTAVNDAPVADAQSVTMAEDTTLAVTLTGSDVDGDALSFSVVTSPTHGTLTGVAPGLTYTPDANYNGPDSFAFTVSDGTLTGAPATVTITVTAVNDAPGANAGADQTVDEGATVALSGSASDIDGDALTVSWVQTAGPSVTLVGANTLTPSFSAPPVSADTLLTFSLSVSDGVLVTSDTVNVTVRDASPTTFQPARSKGYWKNHETHLAEMLAQGPISLGDTTVTTVAHAVAILSNADAKDARNSLRAQLLATVLNLRNGADPNATGADIRPTVAAAQAFLASHPGPVDSKHPDRAAALALKDKLEAFNTSGEGQVDDEDDDDREGRSDGDKPGQDNGGRDDDDKDDRSDKDKPDTGKNDGGQGSGKPDEDKPNQGKDGQSDKNRSNPGKTPISKNPSGKK